MLSRWLESAMSLYKLYMKIAELEINDQKNSQEYNMLLDLLDDARRFETQKINNISMTKDNINRLYYEIAHERESSKEKVSIANCFKIPHHSSLMRIANILDQFNIETYEDDEDDDLEFIDIFDVVDQSEKERDHKMMILENFYSTHSVINYLYVSSLALQYTKEKRVRKFIIYTIYYTIFLYPTYEDYFITTKKIMPPITMSDYSYEVEDLDDKSLIDEFIKEIFIVTIEELLDYNDEDLLDKNQYFTYIRDYLEVLGALSNLDDLSDIDGLENEVSTMIEKIDENMKKRILDDINKMFEVARKIITDKHHKKKVLKDEYLHKKEN